MNSGFNLRTALHVAKRELITGHQYIVVGDGGTTICQSRSGSVVVLDISNRSGNSWEVVAEMFPNGPYGKGSLTKINMSGETDNHYIPTSISIKCVQKNKLRDFLELETVPIFIDDELTWSDEFGID
jgi:hypothetical protein